MYIIKLFQRSCTMQRKKWFRVFIYLMLIAMIGSTLLIVLEPLLLR